MFRKHLWVGLCLLAAAAIASGEKPADVDATAERPVRAPRELSSAERRLAQPGKRIQYDERRGVPTFIWAAPASAAERKARGLRIARAADPAAEARRHAEELAPLYGLEKGDIEAAKVVAVQDTGSGPIIVKFQEEVGGIEVFREEMSVLMDRDLERIALSGYLSGAGRQIAAAGGRFSLDERSAVAIAVSDRTGQSVSARELVTSAAKQGSYGFVDHGARTLRAIEPSPGEAASPLTEPVRYKKVYFHDGDSFEPAYYIEVMAELKDEDGQIDNDYYAYVVSATEGRILFRHNQTVSESFTYRLWADTAGGSVNFPSDSPHGDITTPHPTGNADGFTPPYIASSLHTLQAFPFSHSATDPWLPATASETVGNNVDAYLDRFGEDGFQPASGDFRAPLSSALTFDYTFDPTVDALANTTQQKAAITSLFYIDNFLHDYFYDAGFDEASRNAQQDNYGRGGVGGDTIRAEAQDSSGTNNANMSTPADGGRPRQQMYVWSGPQNETITVLSQPGATLPPSYSPFQIGTASFGPQSFDVTAEVVRAIPNDACSAITNDVVGKIVFIDRGGATCPAGFAGKTANASTAGAVGVIIANVATSGNRDIAPNMGTTNPPCPAQPGNPLGGCTVGTLSLNFADGEAWRAALASGTVTARLKRDLVIQRDGSLDANVVAHEWGHYLSNRLVGNASGLSTNQSRGMGEGWSDFVSLLTTVRAEDISVPSNASWNGVFPLVSYAAVAFSTDPYYFGIRRVPYSTDTTKDPLTFKHIANGNAISPPFAGPCNGCTDASNQAEVHNTGEIWATMLWECFASLLNHHPFEDARLRMRNYLVAGLKMTPNQPTFTEARDGLLAATLASDPADYVLFCDAFSKRGAGSAAVSPDRFSTTNAGVVESYVCENFLVFQSATLSVPTDSCDGDAYLDNLETATLTVTLRNTGNSALNATTATVSSSNPNIFFANGGSMTFPPSAPFQYTTGNLAVSMAGAVGIQDFYIDIQPADPAITPTLPASHLGVRGNANDVPNASASDNVEAIQSAWNSGPNTNGDWVRQQSPPASALPVPPFNYIWHCPDQGSVSDIRLTSPSILAGAGGTTFTFKHRFRFENTFDGGVIEVSTDNGATWNDIGAANLSPTYAAAALVAGSPLAGRRAYTGNSAGYPAFVTVTGTLGASFAGMNVRIRFRAASDTGTAATGWDLDDIVFNNISNTPFTALQANPASPSVDALSPAHAWIGLKNNAGLGNDPVVRFDLKAEVLRNGNVIGSGQINDVSGFAPGFAGAADRAIALALGNPGHDAACTGDTLAIRLSVRMGATGASSATARLWYNDAIANSRFGVTISGSPMDLYLLSGFALGTSPGAGPRQAIDVDVDRAVGGNPWKPFGTWTQTF